MYLTVTGKRGGGTMAVMMVVLVGSTRSIITQVVPEPAPPSPPLLDTTSLTQASQSTSLFQRVDVMFLDQLVVLGGVVQPYSCWCGLPGASCPVQVPDIPFHQVLSVNCGKVNVHCCLEREELDQQRSPLEDYHNITTAQELASFFDYITDILQPYKNKPWTEDSTREDEVLLEGGSQGANCPQCQQNKNDVISEDQDFTERMLHKPSTGRPSHTLQDVLLVALKDMAHYLLTLTSEPRNVDTSLANTTIILKKRETQEFNTPSEYYSHTEVNESVSVDIKTKQLAGLYNASNDIIEKGDFALPYDGLGWFSKVVEMAVDGSLYVGLALVVMFFAASLLVGGMTLIGDTCFICSIIGYANTFSIP